MRKTVKIKRTTTISPKEKGRLDMPGFGIINKSLKVMSVKQLNESTAAACSCQILMEYLKPLAFSELFDLRLEQKVKPTQFNIDNLLTDQ